ncbi:hypothetical protein M440DRAFT_1139750 [Trichoderma longibrachiatum ATCC 18648]|uniref:Uncharacterized protein n=1 Tax=Trichoderma longibrachiatum ATCC 18648 TaxID=983965 RepID=A0A2T4BR08_TRILO|nr:hypothetical protein M440DRAFT_1139750 [Trichoderma longibrachiatum ATCC 18648]
MNNISSPNHASHPSPHKLSLPLISLLLHLPTSEAPRLLVSWSLHWPEAVADTELKSSYAFSHRLQHITIASSLACRKTILCQKAPVKRPTKEPRTRRIIGQVEEGGGHAKEKVECGRETRQRRA